jgi:hypothetical protein
MSQDSKIYLGKQGKIYGPYTQKELQHLDQNGELENYTFIWNTSSESWTPIEAPPPHPETSTRKGRSTSGISWADIEAIGHNFVHAVSGKLDRVTETGCDFLTPELDESPAIALNSKLILNMIDPKKGKTTSVITTLSDIKKKGSSWVYRLQWEKLPHFS